MTEKFNTNSPEETEALGESLAKKLDTGGIKSAFVALRGEMGVGKTAFVRGFARYFEISGVKSPTYTVVNEYKGRTNIFHFDMYRLIDEDDLFSIGYEDYLNRVGFSICEWTEKIEGLVPGDAVNVTILRDSENEMGRTVIFDIPENLK